MAAQLLLSLSILVALHEFGHLITAKLFKMRVEKYYIGFPPKVFSFMWKGTEYGWGAIPLGGFVKISGMIDESMDKSMLTREPEPWEFRSKPAWQRLIVMLGGIIMNVITGIVIFSIIFIVVGEKYIPMSSAKYGIVTNEVAKSIGLKDFDKITAVNGKPIDSFEDIYQPDALLNNGSYYTIEREGKEMKIELPSDLADKLSDRSEQKAFIAPAITFKVGKIQSGMPAASADIREGDSLLTVNGNPVAFFHVLQSELLKVAGKKVKITLDRSGQTLEKEVTITSDGKLGFQQNPMLATSTITYDIPTAFNKGTQQAFDIVWLNIAGFGKMFKGELNPANAVQGPIGMAQSLFGAVWNWENFWRMTGVLSMALAFMNLLPIPALDGGHVVFLLYEMITRRKPSDKFLERAQMVGMVLLLSLIVLTFFNDIVKLFR
jgi:regulator of sigma E protease